jgi:hypothetical protein
MIFGDVVRKKLLRLESRGKEVDVVENGVASISFRKNRRELRLPNALREPGSRGTLAEIVLDIVGKTDNLHTLVRGRNRNENWLVKTASDHFHLSGFHQRPYTPKIFGAVFFDPGQQRTRIVETYMDARMPLESFDEGEIATRVGLLKNIPKVAARLMRVNEQD